MYDVLIKLLDKLSGAYIEDFVTLFSALAIIFVLLLAMDKIRFKKGKDGNRSWKNGFYFVSKNYDIQKKYSKEILALLNKQDERINHIDMGNLRNEYLIYYHMGDNEEILSRIYDKYTKLGGNSYICDLHQINNFNKRKV